MTPANSILLIGALLLFILPSAASAQTLQTLIDACNAGNASAIACDVVNNSIPSLPDNLTAECRWNGSNCSAFVQRDLTDVIAAFEANPAVDNVTFIQNGTQTSTVVVYAEPYQPFHEHVVLSDALFSSNPEMWLYVTATNNLLTPSFNVSSLNPTELGVEDLEEIGALLNNSGIDAGAGVVPDLAILKDVQNFTWNLSLPYNESRTLAGIMACNGSLELNSCTNATPAFDGTWYGLAACGTCGSCADDTYALDCPNSGWITVYGADPLPVYTQDAPSCGGTITNDTTLSGDLACNGTALTINTTGVSLDCAGYHIEGNGTGYGVNIVNASGVTVTNCAINNFSQGIYALRSNDSTLSANTVTNTFTGILLERSANATLTANSLYEYSTGINLYLLSTDATVTDNNLTGAAGGANIGIEIDGASRSLLRNNRVRGHYGYGISLGGAAQHVRVEDNTLEDNNYSAATKGIGVTADYNNLTGNIIRNNGLGIWILNYPHDLYIANNTITDNIANGIEHFSGNDNTITQNTVTGNGRYGIYLFEQTTYSHDNAFTANTVCSNGEADIVVNGTGDNNTGHSNTCDSAANWTDTGSNGTCTFTCDGMMTGCGQVYSQVTVSRNLESNGTCATLIDDNAGIDCAGRSLTGNYSTGAGYGVYADGESNTSIENCHLQGYFIGVSYDCGAPTCQSPVIRNNTLTNITNDGIHCSAVADARISANIVMAAGDDGIHLFASDNVTLEGNTITDSNDEGLLPYSIDDSTIANNTVLRAGDVGIRVRGNRNTLSNNHVENSTGDGILLESADDGTLTGNLVLASGTHGLNITATSTGNTLAGNLFCGSTTADITNATTGNTGDDTTCSTPGTWSDTGTTGCSSPCADTYTSQCGDLTDHTALTADITIEGDCFGFTAHGASLDCRGHSITGNRSGYGVSSGLNRLAVTNCTFANFSTGIYLAGSDDSNVTDNTVTDCSSAGILLTGDTFHVSGNTVTRSNQGLYLFHTENASVTDNDFSGNEVAGIQATAFAGPGDVLTGNRLCNNNGTDLRNEAGDNASGTSNTCDTATDWQDTGATANCTHTCAGLMTGCGEVYADATLTRDLTSNGTCITVTASGVSLDCAGHAITGNYTSLAGRGIYADRVGDLAIENCTIQGYKDGINVDCGCAPGTYSNLSVSDCTLKNHTSYGLYVSDLSQSIITSNTIYDNGDDGLHLVDTPHATVTDNTLENNTGLGLYLSAGNDSRIQDNTVAGNNENGVTVTGLSRNITIQSNTFTNNGWHGLQLLSLAHENTLTNNLARSNGWSGFASNTDNNTFTANNATTNVFHGFHLVGEDNTLTGNRMENNTQRGIYLNTGDTNTLTDNIILNSGTSGVYLDDLSDTNTLATNIVCGSGLADLNNSGGAGTGNAGDNNSCSATKAWNDTGTTGCTYTCAGLTACGTVSHDIVLQNNLAANGTCLTTAANSITIDCAGHTLAGNGNGTGISASNNDVTITNCTVIAFFRGITLGGATNRILENTVLNTTDHSILVSGSGHSIQSNTVYYSGDGGIQLASSSNTNITNNVFSNNTGRGLRLSNSAGSNHWIASNTMCYNGAADISNGSSGTNNLGDYNTCNVTDAWNDAGTTNCTYVCGTLEQSLSIYAGWNLIALAVTP